MAWAGVSPVTVSFLKTYSFCCCEQMLYCYYYHILSSLYFINIIALVSVSLLIIAVVIIMMIIIIIHSLVFSILIIAPGMLFVETLPFVIFLDGKVTWADAYISCISLHTACLSWPPTPDVSLLWFSLRALHGLWPASSTCSLSRIFSCGTRVQNISVSMRMV